MSFFTSDWNRSKSPGSSRPGGQIFFLSSGTFPVIEHMLPAVASTGYAGRFMPTATRWSATIVIEWKPSLTFSRRRVALLDWYESNVDVVSFEEDVDHVGVAVKSRSQRIIVDRSSATIQLRDPSARLEGFLPVLGGIWEVLALDRSRVRSYTSAWSLGVDRDYLDACARLAIRAAGPIPEFVGQPRDCAALVDIVTALGEATVEMGIVHPLELRTRLAIPEMSRLGKRHPMFNREPMDLEEEIPPTSLFVDVHWRPKDGTEGRSPEAALEAAAAAEVEVARLVQGLHGAV